MSQAPQLIASRLAAALDAEDYAAARDLLAEDCVYHTGAAVIMGPEAVVESYRANGDAARRRFDELQYFSSVESTRPSTAAITFTDRLRLGDQWHEYVCRQHIRVGPTGLVVGRVARPAATADRLRGGSDSPLPLNSGCDECRRPRECPASFTATSTQEDAMLPNGLRRPRFSLKSVFILMLGIAIGFALNLQTWRLLTGPSNESQMVSLPTYVVEPPDILQIDLLGESPNASTAVTGQHLVAMDGRINFGAYGSVYVAGMTLEEARTAIELKLSEKLEKPEVAVDVLAYNSKVYYVVNRDPSRGDDVTRFPITGNETALDAIAQVGGVKAPESAEVWIARPASNGVGSENILAIDWDDIARGASTTNYQLLPGDRVFISQKPAVAAPR